MTHVERRVSSHLHGYAQIDVTESDIAVAHERLRYRLASRQDRRRTRPILLAAAAAAVAVIVGVTWWLVNPAPESTAPMRPPTPTTSSTLPGWERVAVPPAGTAPSGPVSGTLELFYWGPGGDLWGKNRVWVYSDGRLIIQYEDELTPRGVGSAVTGLLERRLTPQGVELLKAEVVTATGLPAVPWFSSLVVRQSDHLETAATLPGRGSAPEARFADSLVRPELWLPESAWADRVPRAYVPWTYAVCGNHLAAALPAAARDPLRAAPKAHVVPVGGDPGSDDDCRELTTADARALVGALEAGGLQRFPDPSNVSVMYVLAPEVNRSGSSLPPDLLLLQPILPHGGWACACG